MDIVSEEIGALRPVIRLYHAPPLVTMCIRIDDNVVLSEPGRHQVAHFGVRNSWPLCVADVVCLCHTAVPLPDAASLDSLIIGYAFWLWCGLS